MGHIRLGTLPASKKWRAVVAALEAGADVSQVAAAAAEASKLDLSRATEDPAFRFVCQILVEMPLRARAPGFEAYLESLGISAAEAASVPGLLAAISRAIDAEHKTGAAANDLGGMAKAALMESLAVQMRDRLPSLFEPTPEEVRRALGQFSSGQNFAALARDFFARLTYRSLDYYLSRELANHTGRDRRFSDDAARVAFQSDLARYTFEASKIVEVFAGGWYGKHIWRGSGLTPEKIDGFAAYAFRKLRAELGRRENA